MDLRAAGYEGGVVFTWRGRVGDEGRLGEAFEHGRTRVALAEARTCSPTASSGRPSSRSSRSGCSAR